MYEVKETAGHLTLLFPEAVALVKTTTLMIGNLQLGETLPTSVSVSSHLAKACDRNRLLAIAINLLAARRQYGKIIPI